MKRNMKTLERFFQRFMLILLAYWFTAWLRQFTGTAVSSGQRSDTDRISGGDPLRDAAAHIIDLLESEFLHDVVGLPRSVTSTAVDEIDLITIKYGQIGTESLAVEIEIHRSRDMPGFHLSWRSNVQQDELRIVLKGENHVHCLLACNRTIMRHPVVELTEFSHRSDGPTTTHSCRYQKRNS